MKEITNEMEMQFISLLREHPEMEEWVREMLTSGNGENA